MGAVFNSAEIVGLTGKNDVDEGFYYDDILGYGNQMQAEFPQHYNFYTQQEKEDKPLYSLNGCDSTFLSQGNVNHLMVHPMNETIGKVYNPYVQFPGMHNSILGSYNDYCQNMDSNISPLLQSPLQPDNYPLPEWQRDAEFQEPKNPYSSSRMDCSTKTKGERQQDQNQNDYFHKSLYEYSPPLHRTPQDIKRDKDDMSSVSREDSMELLSRRRKSTSCLRHPVAAVCRTTERMQVFDSILEASLALDVPRSNIQSCLKRHGKTAKGFWFKELADPDLRKYRLHVLPKKKKQPDDQWSLCHPNITPNASPAKKQIGGTILHSDNSGDSSQISYDGGDGPLLMLSSVDEVLFVPRKAHFPDSFRAAARRGHKFIPSCSQPRAYDKNTECGKLAVDSDSTKSSDSPSSGRKKRDHTDIYAESDHYDSQSNKKIKVAGGGLGNWSQYF